VRDVALFADVDITLTKKHVQSIYAAHIGCKREYLDLERRLDRGEIGSDKFGQELVGLFAAKKFTKSEAAKYYASVERQSWLPLILGLDADVYFVSAGPSYFVHPLAEECGVSVDRVLCSVYDFHHDTGLIARCRGVTPTDKADFVRRKSRHYRASIGIGDSPRSDGPFLAACTVSILAPAADSASAARSSQPDIAEKLRRAWHEVSGAPLSEEKFAVSLEGGFSDRIDQA
jgi:phosphoserine phosphatase